jgi:hypothetical protein
MAQGITSKIVQLGLRVMSPILVPLFWVLEKSYSVVFGHVDLRMSREADKNLGDEILSKLRFLFDSFGGNLSDDETIKHPRPFDYALKIVTLHGFSLRFIRGRGELTVLIAPEFAPATWDDLATVLNLIDDRFEQRYFSTLDELAAILEPRMTCLQWALSEEEYPEFQKKIENARAYDRAVIRQWETEINRRLFPAK